MIDIKKCKWCNKDIVGLRSDAIFCRRVCKNIYRRAEKNKIIKDDEKLQLL